MSDDRSTFEVTRARLEDIVVQVRRKDVSLEQSLDLLEEAVRLVNQCNDLIDQTSFRAVSAEGAETAAEDADATAEALTGDAAQDLQAAADDTEVVEVLVIDGDDVVAVEFFDADVDGEDGTVMLLADIEDDERS
jgi:exodeoxyribonuclease VII small subunit